MQTLMIVKADVAAQAFPQCSWVHILVQIDVLILQGSENSIRPFVMRRELAFFQHDGRRERRAQSI